MRPQTKYNTNRKNICSYLFHFTLLDTFFQDLNIFQLKCDWLNGLKAIQWTPFSSRFSKYRKFTSLIAVTFTSIKQSWFPFSGHESQQPVFLILYRYGTVTYLIKTKNNLSSEKIHDYLPKLFLVVFYLARFLLGDILAILRE